MGGNQNATEEANREYTVLFTKSGEAVLTERGWLEAFRYFEGEKIDKYINENMALIISNSSFEVGKDYNLEDGTLTLTLRGLERACREIDGIRQLNNAFYANSDFGGLTKAINNSLTAYFVLEQGKEYILDGTEVVHGMTKKKVLLVSNGRTAEGRVYSDGLQQAIELKEERLNKGKGIKIETTVEHDELASISQRAFYSIYPKIAGMTGTSADMLFEEVYGMRTAKIPKNSEYDVSMEDIDAIYSGRTDNDTILFETEEEKLNAVISSILQSQKTGQPVLVATTSVNESKRLFAELQKRGIDCQVLNAEVSNIEEENEIISHAGRRGAVTISTQMAGRGTDIKLGGTLDDHIELLKRQEITRAVGRMAQLKGITDPAILRKVEIEATSYVERKLMPQIREAAVLHLEEERKELTKVGGLKVVGYGHFQTKRDDDQLRGRAARQADPGVTEFYCSVRDLKETLGIPNDRIKLLRKKGLAKGSPISGPLVEREIDHAQTNIEGTITSVIVDTQERDYHLSKMRKIVYDQRMRMMKGENPQDNMEFIIDTTARNLIDRNLPDGTIDMNPRKRLDRTGINIHNLIIDVEETFGIDLTEKFENGEFDNLGEIERYISTLAKDRYREIRTRNGNQQQDKQDRATIIGTIDSAWRDFNLNLEQIKSQNMLHALAQNQDYDEIFAMRKGFNQAMIDAKISTISKMLGKKSAKTRIADTTIDIEESVIDSNDYYVEDTRPKTSNITIRPAKLMTAIAHGVKVIKDKIKYQFELVPYDESVVEQVEQFDFEGTKTADTNSPVVTMDELTSGIAKPKK